MPLDGAAIFYYFVYREIGRKMLMDFIEELRNLSARITRQKDVTLTEEATKHAFVMPFINLFGI